MNTEPGRRRASTFILFRYVGRLTLPKNRIHSSKDENLIGETFWGYLFYNLTTNWLFLGLETINSFGNSVTS